MPPAPDATGTQPPATYVPITPAIVASPPPPAPSTAIMAIPAAPPLQIESPVGSIRLGLLLQPQFESLGSVSANGYANNLYLRRTRILAGGSLFGMIDYFVETDAPNLFKGATAVPAMGAQPLKGTSAMIIQDAFGTVKPMGDLLKVDVGYMLPPQSHNAIQGAGTLYGWDYFAYTFQNSNAFGAVVPPAGRDLGFELRGLVLGGHLEYRAGMFQGQRNPAIAAVPATMTPGDQSARNFFRVAARVQVNFFDPEPGFFYAGTYLGAKKILSIGGSYDFQSDYKAFSFDGFLDMPLGPGVVTGQVDYSHWDGGNYLPLPKQWAIQGEAGYTFLGVKVAPIVRIEHLKIDATPPAANTVQNRYAGGIAYWCYGHNSNAKLFYTRIQEDGALHGANQINLQWQVYFF